MTTNVKKVKKLNPTYAKAWVLETVNEVGFNIPEIKEFLDENGFSVRHMELKFTTMFRKTFQIYFWDYQNLNNLKKLNDEVSWWTNKHWNVVFKGKYIPIAKHVDKRRQALLLPPAVPPTREEFSANLTDEQALLLEKEMIKQYNTHKNIEYYKSKGYQYFADE